MYKIFVSGNYFYAIKGSIQFEGFAKEVKVRKGLVTDTDYSFTGVNGLSESEIIPLSNIVDKAGLPYTQTSFESFYETETGKSSGGGSGQGASYITVNTFLNLPTTSTVDTLYYVETTTGIFLLGTRKKQGFYRWNGTKWITSELPEELINEKEHGAPAHVSSKKYYTGNIIWHNGALQRCKADISAKTFTQTDWELIKSSSSWIASKDGETATHNYYGGLNSAGGWQINRFDKATTTRDKAIEINNSTITTLSNAWANRLILTYV